MREYPLAGEGQLGHPPAAIRSARPEHLLSHASRSKQLPNVAGFFPAGEGWPEESSITSPETKTSAGSAAPTSPCSYGGRLGNISMRSSMVRLGGNPEPPRPEHRDPVHDLTHQRRQQGGALRRVRPRALGRPLPDACPPRLRSEPAIPAPQSLQDPVGPASIGDSTRRRLQGSVLCPAARRPPWRLRTKRSGSSRNICWHVREQKR